MQSMPSYLRGVGMAQMTNLRPILDSVESSVCFQGVAVVACELAHPYSVWAFQIWGVRGIRRHFQIPCVIIKGTYIWTCSDSLLALLDKSRNVRISRLEASGGSRRGLFTHQV